MIEPILQEQIIEEIKELAKTIGRQPSREEWRKHFRHGGGRPDKYGGYANLVRIALYPSPDSEVEIEKPPEDEMSDEELIEYRAAAFERRKNHTEGLKAVKVRMKLDGPVGICHLGDPHIDDNGTDIKTLEHDTGVVRTTPGLFAANVGDNTNNWTGRLARLYDQQNATAAEAWQLTNWLIEQCDWLYLIGGNHDLWSGAGNPINWMIRHKQCAYGPSRIRLCLRFPGTKRIVHINARHDFRGTSQWNPAHAVMKSASMGWHDEILICGHKHKSGYGLIKDPKTGVISHALQVASYKRCDEYAAERNFPDQHLSCSMTTIINPKATEENDLVNVFLNLDRAADYLTYLRNKK